MTTSESRLTSAVSITFSGPFVYDFGEITKSGLVTVYAPYCPYHLGGIFFSLNSLSENDLWQCAQSRHPKDKLVRTYAVTGGISANPMKSRITSFRHSRRVIALKI